jgi:DNA-binding NtrC family response regulator
MRFVNTETEFNPTIKLQDWPLAYRFALLVLPGGVALVLFAIWLGYSASSATLMDSLQTLPMLEAKIQATSISKTLEHLRASLSKIAQIPQTGPEESRKTLEMTFQGYHNLITDFSVKTPSGKAFMLFRDGDAYNEFANGAVSGSAYSPFQQLSTRPPHPGAAILYPIVYEESPRSVNDASTRAPVLRMAYQPPDGSCILVLGIDINELCHELAGTMRIDSPLRLPQQEDSHQLSFFFDLNGWILFEMRGDKSLSFIPDTARQGYSGDLGRPGYDAAFRPWATHTNFWRMVTNVQADRTGSFNSPADKYVSGPKGATGILSYVPVRFRHSDTDPPGPVGGIAFFETTSLPMAAFLRLINYSLIMVVGAIALSILLTYRFNKRLAQPFKKMASDLNAMQRNNAPTLLGAAPTSREQQRLQAAVNDMLSTTMHLQDNLRLISREMRHSRAQQPVNLTLGQHRAMPESELGLLGSSRYMHDVREKVRKAAKAGTDVLVWGETGTGKELVAAAIHKSGPRGSGPFISINCGALDENLLMDTLFGHVKGAFTEAKSDRKGAFLSANGGVLHLDEIGNASPKVQQALLRSLAARRIRPLGSDKEIAFNTCVVAATNVDLRESVRQGQFREDLYFRLAIITIETPPLRHRKDDIPELAAFCIHEAAQALDKPEPRLSRGALEMLTAYDWPGNVRELKNCLTRALAFVEGDLILPQHITLERDGAYGKSLYTKQESHAGGNSAAQNSAGEASTGSAAASPGTDKSLSRGAATASGDYLWPPPPRDFLSPTREKRITPESLLMGGPFPIYPLYGSYSQPVESKVPLPHYTPPQPHPMPEVAPIASVPHLPLALNDRQQRALLLIQRQGEFTRAQYEAVAGRELSSRTAQNDLREMVERGILERVGAGPGTRYVLKQPPVE